MDIYEQLAGLGAMAAQFRERADRDRFLAIQWLHEFGIRAELNRDGRIVVGESGLEELKRFAKPTFPSDRPLPPDSAALFRGIPIVTAPDWTMDPAIVAQARAAAVLRRPFRRALTWLERH